MSCRYCDGRVIFSKEVITENIWRWCYNGEKISLEEANVLSDPLGVFIDRGYLRFTDLDDYEMYIGDCKIYGIKHEDIWLSVRRVDFRQDISINNWRYHIHRRYNTDKDRVIFRNVKYPKKFVEHFVLTEKNLPHGVTI